MQLAEVDLLGVVQVARGPQNDEQGVAVSFQFRPLMRDDRVLDCELVQRELPRQREKLLFGWPVKPDPCHTARFIPEYPVGVGQRLGRMHAAALDIDSAVDKGGASVRDHAFGTRIHRLLRRFRVPATVNPTGRTFPQRQRARRPVGHGSLQARRECPLPPPTLAVTSESVDTPIMMDTAPGALRTHPPQGVWPGMSGEPTLAFRRQPATAIKDHWLRRDRGLWQERPRGVDAPALLLLEHGTSPRISADPPPSRRPTAAAP